MPRPTFHNLPEEKRQMLINYSIEEFASNDYHSASISRIVTRAGIAKGSLYQYFEDKRDLYLYLLELAAERKAEFLSQAAPPADDMNLFDTLRWLFEVMIRFQLVYPGLSKIGYRAVYEKSPAPEDLVTRAAQSTRHYIEEMIAAAKRRGEVRYEIDSNVAAFLFTAALTELPQFLTAHYRSKAVDMVPLTSNAQTEKDISYIYEQIITILQHGIGVTGERTDNEQ